MAVPESAETDKRHHPAFLSPCKIWLVALAVCLAVTAWAGVSNLLPATDIKWIPGLLGAAGFVAVLAAGLYARRSSADSRRVETELELEAIAARSVFRHSSISLAVFDSDGRFQTVNEGTTELFGYGKEELVGKRLLPLIVPADRQQLQLQFASVLRGEVQQTSIKLEHRSGIPLDVQLTLMPYGSERGKRGVVMISQDLSEYKRSHERIRYMAYYDDMTGLPNRRMFMAHLAESLSRLPAGRRSAVLYLDLDQFKLVNDSFGRDFGDMLLMQVAERLTRGLEEHDLAARMEGDEFAILYGAVASDDDAMRRARRVLALLEEPFELQGHHFHLSASIGIATGAGDCDDSNLMVKKADIALGNVKDNGRNGCQLYSGEFDNSSLEKLTMQHELREALKRREFILYYQPQFQIATGRVIGMEALIRWQHPRHGLIPPGQFIAIAEDCGLIVQLGDWVLEEACRQNKSWQDSGLLPVPVSVNLSIRQFLHQNLADKVADVLHRTGLDPSYLDLEITESMTMDVKRATDCLHQLARLGVGISIDDFGTGYSSFSYLKNFPIGRLKIDRSFVHDLQHDPNDAAIVAAIIAMAHNLNMQVVAEGVETEAQAEFLRKHRCDAMQGYYRSAPVPQERMREMLKPGGGASPV